MHSQLEEYRSEYHAVKVVAEDLAAYARAESMRTAPESDTWSPVQCLDHLNTAGWLILRSMENAIQRGRSRNLSGEPPFEYGFISRWFIRSMRPSSDWTFTAPSIFEPEPTDTLYPSETVNEFCALQDRFAECVVAAEGLDLRGLRMPSPAIPLLRISLGAWFEATIAHERRHLEQARAVLEAASSRPSSA